MDGPLRGIDQGPVMSAWEQGDGIRAGFSSTPPLELMLSASDVVAWLRHHATTENPCRVGPPAEDLADHLASLCFDSTRDLLDGSGS